MTRYAQSLCVMPLLLVAACNVTKDPGNDSTTVSIDQNRIEDAGNVLLNEAAEATDVAANAIENTVPAIENSAATIKERAGRVIDKAERVDVDVNVGADNKAEPAKQ